MQPAEAKISEARVYAIPGRVAKFAAKDIGRRARAPLEQRKLGGVRIC